LPIRVKLTIAFVALMAVVLAATGLFLYLRFDTALDTRACALARRTSEH
jgi:hypothetical protein